MNELLAEDTNWATCPVCGSIQIEGGNIEIEGIEAYQQVDCLHCHATWREVYAALQRDDILAGEKLFEVSFRFYTRSMDNATVSSRMKAALNHTMLQEPYDGWKYLKVIG